MAAFPKADSTTYYLGVSRSRAHVAVGCRERLRSDMGDVDLHNHRRANDLRASVK